MKRGETDALMDLPHPVRADAAFGGDAEVAIFPRTVWADLRPALADASRPTEWLLNFADGLYELAAMSHGFGSTVNLGLLSLVLARARLRAFGDPILKVHPDLYEQLTETDIGEKLPIALFRLPYTCVYVEFSQPSGLEIFNKASGAHEVEGAYVGQYTVEPGSFIFDNTERKKYLDLDPGKPTTIIEIVVTGSPRGKANVLDDASQNVTLFLQDGDMDLATAIDRHFTLYRRPDAETFPGFVPASDQEQLAFERTIYQLAKVVLYLNLPEAETRQDLERTELLRQLKRLGPKKAARLQRKLPGKYDRIIIGGRRETESSAHAVSSTEPAAVRPHWRRGHFRRIRFGEGLAQSRLGWIRPVLVNATAAFHPIPVKGYEVR